MTSKKLFIKIGFIPLPVPVSLNELRKLVDTRQPSNWLIGIFAKQSNININELADFLSITISPQPNIANQVLRSEIGAKITSLLEIIVKSKDANISIHQLICDGVESSLADDGKLSLLEVLEKMPGEVVLDVDEFNHFYQAYSKGDIKKFLSIETEKKSNLRERDIFLWHFIDRSHLSRLKKQALLSRMGVDGDRLTKADKTIDLENFVRRLEPKLVQELLEEYETLANEYLVESDRNSSIINILVRQLTPDSSQDNQWIFERGFAATVRAIQFSSDGKFLAAGSDDKYLHVWKTYNEGKSYTRRFKLGHEAEVRAIAFSPKGYILASAGEDKSIELWNAQTGESIRALPRIQKYGIFSLAFINEETLACGSWDRSIMVWNTSQGALKRTLTGHEGSIWSMDFQPDTKILASSSDDGTVRLWDLETGRVLRVLSGHKGGVFSVKFSPDRRTLATGSWDKSIRLWRVEDGECLAELKGHEAAVWQVRYTSDSNFLISSADDSSIAVWNLEKQDVQLKLQGHTNGVYSLDISPIQPLVISGSWDKTMRIWRLDL
ncbi:MAG: WD40 repeat domain-containing protein [Cyanosarcina radialis HA8281-LM2]|jgi:WD40 repeat protein|nr:WD40 repeat domain-containing protein [Cyanosarcina radialis HA8281-LM2]